MQLSGEYQVTDSAQMAHTYTHARRHILIAVQGSGCLMAGTVRRESNWDVWVCVARVEKGGD